MTRLKTALILLSALGLMPTTARAQPKAPAPPPDRGALDQPYIDASVGFAIRPPAVCEALREQQYTSTMDLERVRFVHAANLWSLSVRQSQTKRPLDADAIIKGITEELTGQHQDVKDVKVLRGEPVQIASREGVRYAATLVVQGKRFLRQQAVIRTRPTEYFALVFVTPQADSDVVMPLFDKIVASFEILRSDEKDEQLRAALTRGAAVLRAVSSGQTDLAKAVRDETFLLCLIDGKETGFIQIREQAAQADNHQGVMILKWAWLFRPDGGITHLRHNMFLASDLSIEEWENRLVILTAPQGKDRTRQGLLTLERALRQDNKLTVASTPRPNAAELVEKTLTVEPGYAPAPWDILLPRLIDLKKPELYAFLSYDGPRRALVARTFRVIGPQDLQVGGRRVTGIKLENTEGLVPPTHEIDVDETGKDLRLVLKVPEASTEMVATTRQNIERTYADKIKEAEALFRKYAVPEPIRPRNRGSSD